MSEDRYVNIKVKKEVRDSLVRATSILNSKIKKNKTTVAGLITTLANQYDSQLDETTVFSNIEDWIFDGIPVILDSVASKNFNELKYHDPVNCVVIVSNFIANEALERRLKKVFKHDNK